MTRHPAAATILHVDMDAFFVACELLRRPELRGRPVVVGGSSDRGVVAAASYEARAHGVHSAMASSRARRLCPGAVFLPGDHAYYSAVSADVMAVFHDVTPLVEPLSLDEAFLDVSGATRLLGEPEAIAHAVRGRVREELGLACSVGVARVKLLAKLASESAKPRAHLSGPRPGPGVVVVRPERELAFLHPLPVSRLWGVGPKTLERLGRLGIRTVGDLAAVDRDRLVDLLGAGQGGHLHELAHARDPRPVVPGQRPKSVGHEETFARDLVSPEDLGAELLRLADAVGARLRRHALAGRTVMIKVRFGDFSTITRSVTLDVATDSTAVVTRAAKGLLARIDPSAGVRLLGVSVSGFDVADARQLRLDLAGADVDDPAWEGAEAAVDAIRARFGDAAIGPAAVVGRRGRGASAPGGRPWGPDTP
ncbi:MAG: DNA polymerase IV [Acidimicrobiales bacterium]|nr:DNA polymerase IV [Acidimicrobiales bacterium]